MPYLARTLPLVAVLVGSCVIVDEPPELEINEEPYGECLDEYGRNVCRDDELFCDAYPDAQFAELSVCTGECAANEDCPQPSSGDATVICDGDPAACVLECADGETCPDGMTCAPTNTCMWRAE